MSSTFDSLQYALENLEGDDYLKFCIRRFIDYFHDLDHKEQGLYNRNKILSRIATDIEDYLKKKELI